IFDDRVQTAQNGEATMERILAEKEVGHSLLICRTGFPESVRHRQLIQVGEQSHGTTAEAIVCHQDSFLGWNGILATPLRDVKRVHLLPFRGLAHRGLGGRGLESLLESPLGRGKRRQALGWVVSCDGKPTPSLRATPPVEGIFLWSPK